MLIQVASPGRIAVCTCNVTSKLLPGLTVVNEGKALTLALAATATVLVVVPVGKLLKSGVVVAEELRTRLITR